MHDEVGSDGTMDAVPALRLEYTMPKPAHDRPGSGPRKPESGSTRSHPASGERPHLALDISWWALVAAIALVPMTIAFVLPAGANGAVLNDAFMLPKVLVLRVLTLVSLAAWSLHALTRGGAVRHSPVSWLVLCFLAWATLSTFTSIHSPTALFGKYNRDDGLLAYLNYAVIYFLTLQHITAPGRVRTLARALVWSSVPVALYGVMQYVGLDPVPWRMDFGLERAFSTFGNPDILGGYLMFTIPIALGLALAEERPLPRAFTWLVAFLNLFVLAVSFTRGAWVGGLVGIALLAVMAARAGGRVRRADLIPAGISAAAVAGVLVLQRIYNPNDIYGFGEFAAQRLTGGEVGGVQARLLMWQTALAALRDQPLLGFGLDTFRLISPTYKTAEYVRLVGNSIADNAHNYPLQIAAGVGVVGAVLLFGVYGWAALRSAPRIFASVRSPERLVLGSFWAAAGGYLVNLMFGLSVPGTTFLLWIAIGIVLSPGATVLTFRPPRWGVVPGVVAVALATIGIAYQVPLARADHAQMLATSLPAGNTAVAAARTSVRLNPHNSAYRERLGLVLSNVAIDAVGLIDEAEARGEDTAVAAQTVSRSLDTAELALRDAIAFTPSDYPNYQYLAQLSNLRGDLFGDAGYSKTVPVAEAGLLRDPHAQALHFELAYALDRLDRRAEAISVLENARDIDPGYARTALLLADILVQEGRRADALAVLQSADAARPDQESITSAIEELQSTSS
jgi:putative inorganic carbon (HCO3(-)) transporter